MLSRMLAFGILPATLFAQDAGEGRPDDFDPLAPPSIVVFEEKPRTLAATDLAARLTEATGREFRVVDTSDDLAEDRVWVDGRTGRVRIDGVDVRFEFLERSRVDPEEAARSVRETRTAHCFRIHRSMLDLRLSERSADAADAARRLRILTQVTATVLDDANSLLVSFSSTRQIFVVGDETRAALRQPDPIAAMREAEQPPVFGIADDDPEMLAAVAEARKRWPEFLAAWKKRGAREAFHVKFAADDGEHVEHLWLTVESLDDERVSGRIGNAPVALKGFELNSEHALPVGEVEDWIHANAEGMSGGFSVAVLQKRMREAGADWRRKRLKELEERKTKKEKPKKR